MNKIKIGMAELKISSSPDILMTLGLGSCVSIVLYDTLLKIGGMAHIMLPDSKHIKNNQNKAKFADTAIYVMLDELIKKGCSKERLISKIAGGSQMFSFQSASELMKIGERNVISVKENLKKNSIRLVAEDTGGNHGRTVEFNLSNGIFTIKTIGHGIKEI